MDRLMVLCLETAGCPVEAVLNGMPVAALGPKGGRVSLAVHEYALAGKNQLALSIWPPPPGGQAAAAQPRVAIGPTWARARLLLLRQGQGVGDPNTRVLASAEWAVEEGKSYEAPSLHTIDVDLPVAFPRWRWLDAPPIAINAAVQRQILEFIQLQAIELLHGNPEAMLGVAKLRFDELAIAYQQTAQQGMQRFRDHLQGLYAGKALKIVPPAAEQLVLRPVLGGRLIECLSPLGGPVLRTQNDDPALPDHTWAVRLAMVEGKIYVLR
jgi:hypothetical protein